MPDPVHAGLIVAAGAAAAGFAQGVTGFAFSVVALSFWAWALPPETAAPLAVFGALTGQIASLASVRVGFEWTKIVPLILGGWIGVPATRSGLNDCGQRLPPSAGNRSSAGSAPPC